VAQNDESLGKDYGESTLETYDIGYDNNDQNFSFHTIGSRVAGKIESVLCEFESGVQFGDMLMVRGMMQVSWPLGLARF
jgi:hypothetical protein